MHIVASTSKRLQWATLILLVVSVCINYLDRGNLGVAAKRIQVEMHFGDAQLGLLLGAFFWSYALMQLVAGKIVDRWNVMWVMAFGYLLWSLATGVTGLVSSFAALFILRLCLGVGESVAYPSYSKIIAAHFSEGTRGAANGLIDAGSKLGPALGILLGVKMVNALSWRGMFLVIGVASLLWMIPWCLIAPRLRVSAEVAKVAVNPPSYANLLRRRVFWGTAIGLFGGNYTWYLMLTWLPYYFETDRHYTHDRLALLGSLPFWAVAASATAAGLFTDLLVRRGARAGPVRRAFVAVGLLGCAAFLFPAVAIRQDILSNILFTLACLAFGLFSANHWAFTQTLAGPNAAGKWTGLENFMGNLSGVAAPYLSGITLAHTHSFLWAFGIACFFLLCSVAGFTVVVGRAEPVSWPEANDAAVLPHGTGLHQV
ncbi:MAG TPA: MFS transporter [Bryobacteraceae bacterium]|jgi:MFS family permease|nr:MFS transporter [Bryobacteraceae bacterium]